MKKLSAIILCLIFIFALASCKNESTQTQTPKEDITEAITEKESQSETDTAPLQSESQTKKAETLSPKEEGETDSTYIKTKGKVLTININPETVEEIQISYLISSSVDKPTQKFIRDKKTIEKIIALINDTKFNVCEDQDGIRKPGTTLIIKIDDKVSMSFQMDLVINGTYCEAPESLSNDILEFYNEAPEKAEPIK